MKLSFNSHDERMTHQFAQLIPKTLWCDQDLFNGEFDVRLIEVMRPATINNVIAALDDIKISNKQGFDEVVFLAIAISHPLMSMVGLKQIAEKLRFVAALLYRMLVTLGDLSRLKAYEQTMPKYWIKDRVIDYDFFMYRLAAQHGYVPIMEHFEEKYPTKIGKMLAAKGFHAYIFAAAGGHLAALVHLEQQRVSYSTKRMPSAIYTLAYRLAAHAGELQVLQHLAQQAPNNICRMIETNGFAPFRLAAARKHFEVCEHIIALKPNFFTEIVRKPQRFKASLSGFTAWKLAALKTKPVRDSNDATLCYYLLEHLIRENLAQHEQSIDFLLSILAVRVLVHREIIPGKPNELIALARRINNSKAVDLLLKIPAVAHSEKSVDFPIFCFFKGCPTLVRAAIPANSSNKVPEKQQLVAKL